ncbi:hypothetical protein TrVE_jg2630 [Triparma verrucosa]|uniref:Uncharacterized protein n=2 Tax=Triparma TaxID=722752 RepID=A0A9W7BGR5_9STRA|nr:hypothetical protein TrVE_jg2630 [Triparma verrucosa]GMH90836.1 hypothetical protein TrST_g3889 [Triparma strigata]
MPQKGNLSPYFLRGPGKAGIVAGVGQGFKLVIGNDLFDEAELEVLEERLEPLLLNVGELGLLDGLGPGLGLGPIILPNMPPSSSKTFLTSLTRPSESLDCMTRALVASRLASVICWLSSTNSSFPLLASR